MDQVYISFWTPFRKLLGFCCESCLCGCPVRTQLWLLNVVIHLCQLPFLLEQALPFLRPFCTKGWIPSEVQTEGLNLSSSPFSYSRVTALTARGQKHLDFSESPKGQHFLQCWWRGTLGWLVLLHLAYVLNTESWVSIFIYRSITASMAGVNERWAVVLPCSDSLEWAPGKNLPDAS